MRCSLKPVTWSLPRTQAKFSQSQAFTFSVCANKPVRTMAEAIGLASGLLTLAVYALKSSNSLYETVQGYRDLPRRVRDLLEEIKALTDVLMPLVDKLQSTPDVDLITLKHPLLRCGTACKGLEEEIRKCFARTLTGRTSFRDWAKLQYMSHNIDEVKLLFSGYRMTIIVALTDASL